MSQIAVREVSHVSLAQRGGAAACRRGAVLLRTRRCSRASLGGNSALSLRSIFEAGGSNIGVIVTSNLKPRTLRGASARLCLSAAGRFDSEACGMSPGWKLVLLLSLMTSGNHCSGSSLLLVVIPSRLQSSYLLDVIALVGKNVQNKR